MRAPFTKRKLVPRGWRLDGGPAYRNPPIDSNVGRARTRGERRPLRSVALLLLLVLGACTSPELVSDPQPTAGAPPPTQRQPPSGGASPSASQPSWQFFPDARRKGSQDLIDASFTDGTRITISTDKQLRVPNMGVVPWATGCGTNFAIVRAGNDGLLVEGEPLETYPTPQGEAMLYKANGRPGKMLLFQFDGWTLGASDVSVKSGQAEGCATTLRGSSGPDGFLVLRGEDLAPATDPNGPELQFGGPPESPSLIVKSGSCYEYSGKTIEQIDGIAVDISDGFASWCSKPDGVVVHLYIDDESKIPDYVEGIRIERD